MPIVVKEEEVVGERVGGGLCSGRARLQKRNVYT